MEMDWSPDFCLACDKQTAGEAYCSQSCRLADLENALTGSVPVSPTESTMISSWPPSHDGGRHGFYLPPPINFAAYKTRSTRPVSTGGNVAEVVPVTTRTRYADSILFRHPTLPSPSNDRNLKRSLTPSSSGSSLSSLQSSSTRDSTCLSDQARHELRSYANSFDQARDWKRRVTLP